MRYSFGGAETSAAAAASPLGLRPRLGAVPIRSGAYLIGWSGAMLEIDRFDLDEIAFALSDQNVYDEHLPGHRLGRVLAPHRLNVGTKTCFPCQPSGPSVN